MQENRDFKFDKRASQYDEGFEGKLSARFYKLLLNQVTLRQGDAVLDVGCGTGTILKNLNERCAIEGYGIDVEENMIIQAKSKCPDMNLFVSGCANTPFEDEKFDIVIACMAYHHFDDKCGFAKEASRIIKPGGFLYIADPRFPLIVRKPLNFAARLHNIAGHFGTAEEIGKAFSAYGFDFVDCKFDGYAQCIKLAKVS